MMIYISLCKTLFFLSQVVILYFYYVPIHGLLSRSFVYFVFNYLNHLIYKGVKTLLLQCENRFVNYLLTLIFK